MITQRLSQTDSLRNRVQTPNCSNTHSLSCTNLLYANKLGNIPFMLHGGTLVLSAMGEISQGAMFDLSVLAERLLKQMARVGLAPLG